MSYEEVKKETKKAFKKFRRNGFIPPIDMTAGSWSDCINAIGHCSP